MSKNKDIHNKSESSSLDSESVNSHHKRKSNEFCILNNLSLKELKPSEMHIPQSILNKLKANEKKGVI